MKVEGFFAELTWDATALRRGASRSLLQRKSRETLWEMPRPCTVEPHARRYKERVAKSSGDATALRRGGSRSRLQKKGLLELSGGCHGLAPWSLTLVATKKELRNLLGDATALRRGGSRSLLIKTSFHVPSIGSVLVSGLSHLLLR